MRRTTVNKLVAMADYFDKVGEHAVSDKIDLALRLAATVNVHQEKEPRPFDKEEEQRLIATEYNHIYRVFLNSLPYITYLEAFWPRIKPALDRCRMIINQQMQEKTDELDFSRFQERFEEIKQLNEKLAACRKQEIGKSRVLEERNLILGAIRGLAKRLRRLYKDDEVMGIIQNELQALLNVFDNVFEQTTGQIADVSLPRGEI